MTRRACLIDHSCPRRGLCRWHTRLYVATHTCSPSKHRYQVIDIKSFCTHRRRKVRKRKSISEWSESCRNRFKRNRFRRPGYKQACSQTNHCHNSHNLHHAKLALLEYIKASKPNCEQQQSPTQHNNEVATTLRHPANRFRTSYYCRFALNPNRQVDNRTTLWSYRNFYLRVVIANVEPGFAIKRIDFGPLLHTRLHIHIGCCKLCRCQYLLVIALVKRERHDAFLQLHNTKNSYRVRDHCCTCRWCYYCGWWSTCRSKHPRQCECTLLTQLAVTATTISRDEILRCRFYINTR